MTTISQIARRARVSTATVSNVLNRTKPVSPQTRELVESVARELGYSPSRFARSLKTGRSATIGLIAPDLTNPFFPAVVQTVERTARERGYGLIIVDCHNDPAEEKAAFELVGEYRVDGIIWIPVAETKPEPAPLAPVVTVDRPVAGLDGITSDHRAGGRMIGERVRRAGHGTVGILRGPSAHHSARERHRGLLEGLGDGVRIVWDVPTDFSLDLAEEAQAKILGTAVDCIVGANDQVAIRTAQLLAAAGRALPDDVAIVGFDDIPWAEFVHPPLSTVRQPYRRLGRAAVELLLRRIAEPDGEPERIVLPVEWVGRASLG
ncbi:LacI family DNA-binding transcriptional regulator [Microbaculum marinum]|uniref:LacI family DNA-binding transcriptional regulator n=1 Tax=Microbaculum marinum TaxID=1764581 RepID=A0AAW9RB44_9HYPH